MTEVTWTTRDGRTLYMSDMETSHLINTINMLRRKHNAAALATVRTSVGGACIYVTTAPDGAAIATEEWVAEQLSQRGIDRVIAKKLPVFEAMIKEATRRKVKIYPLLGLGEL